MFDVSFPIAFVGGFVSFFAPCVVPLLPTYVAYVTGVSLPELRDRGIASYQNKLIISSLLYVLGFSLVFVLLGTTAAGIGSFFRQYDFIIQRIGGALIIIFGLQTAVIFHFPFLSQGALVIPSWVQNFGVQEFYPRFSYLVFSLGP